MDSWELHVKANYAESAVSSADLQAARARARSLSSARNAMVNSMDHKTLVWEFEHQRWENIREPHRGSYHDDMHSRRMSSPTTSSTQLMKGHHRATNTPRPAYRRSLNAANSELMSFREKFDQWKSTYDREIGKTKASLASMTPTLQGLGLAARIHKIAGKAAESLNPTPSKTETPQPSTTVASTPREDPLPETIHMEPSVQPLQLDFDLLSTTDEYPDFLDLDLPLSERAGKLAAVEEDIGVLTTIIEKKIFATHVPNSVCPDDVVVADEDLPVDLCAWSEGHLTARTIKMVEDDNAPPPDHDHELDAAVVEEARSDSPPQAASTGVSKTDLPRSSQKADLGIDPPPPRPVNLRDNLIILAKQKGYAHVGTPSNNEGCIIATSLHSERERAMALLRKMYAPSSPTSTAALQTPVIADDETPQKMATRDENGATESVPRAQNDMHVTISGDIPEGHPNEKLDEQGGSTGLTTTKEGNIDDETTVEDVPTVVSDGSLVTVHREFVLGSF